jgi:hypothetical protein
MTATDFHPQLSTRSFPLLLLVASGLPISGLIATVILIAVRSDFVFIVAFFAVMLAAAGAVIGLLGLLFRERPWWLFLVGLVASASLLYAITFIEAGWDLT